MYKILIFITLLIATNLMASDVKWAKDYESGIEQAVKSNKPMLLISSSHYCKYCDLLEKTTLKDEKVIQALNKNHIAGVPGWYKSLGI